MQLGEVEGSTRDATSKQRSLNLAIERLCSVSVRCYWCNIVQFVPGYVCVSECESDYRTSGVMGEE